MLCLFVISRQNWVENQSIMQNMCKLDRNLSNVIFFKDLTITQPFHSYHYKLDHTNTVELEYIKNQKHRESSRTMPAHELKAHPCNPCKLE